MSDDEVVDAYRACARGGVVRTPRRAACRPGPFLVRTSLSMAFTSSLLHRPHHASRRRTPAGGPGRRRRSLSASTSPEPIPGPAPLCRHRRPAPRRPRPYQEVRHQVRRLTSPRRPERETAPEAQGPYPLQSLSSVQTPQTVYLPGGLRGCGRSSCKLRARPRFPRRRGAPTPKTGVPPSRSPPGWPPPRIPRPWRRLPSATAFLPVRPTCCASGSPANP